MSRKVTFSGQHSELAHFSILPSNYALIIMDRMWSTGERVNLFN